MLYLNHYINNVTVKETKPITNIESSLINPPTLEPTLSLEITFTLLWQLSTLPLVILPTTPATSTLPTNSIFPVTVKFSTVTFSAVPIKPIFSPELTVLFIYKFN